MMGRVWACGLTLVLVLAGRGADAAEPTARCGPIPSGFTELPSVGGDGDTSVDLRIGRDADTQRLCYVTDTLPRAPVIRVGVGHVLSITIRDTLRDTGPAHEMNCPIDSYGSEGNYCLPAKWFSEQPGADGTYYPIEANEAVAADGTSNLHVHGLMVSPLGCGDNMDTAVYPTNWGGKVAMTAGCQTTPDAFTYTYHVPSWQPAGVYWYHDHRAGAAEQETQMGLVGAIVVEDGGDAWRRSIGVDDEVLVVTDLPKKGCLDGVSCDPPHAPHAGMAAVRATATQGAVVAAREPPGVLDPRIDEAHQDGCALGASSADGGNELWTLRLNGADVPETARGFPPDSELLARSMRPGQRLIFRLVNGSADSFVAPELVLSRGGVERVQKLEVFARDGVGLADAGGARMFGWYDVARSPLIVPPAGRIEFVVHAPPPGATLYLQSPQVAPGCGGNAYPQRRLLRITTAGEAVAAGAADDRDLLAHTPSLAPYVRRLGTVATVHRTFVFSEFGRGFTYHATHWPKGAPTNADYNQNLADFYITETASDDGGFDPRKTALVPFRMDAPPQVVVHLHGRESVTEEWVIQNATLEAHAFHIHQIHFTDVTDLRGGAMHQPILDTVVVPPARLVGGIAAGVPGAPGWVRLRMTFSRHDIGVFMYHCHLLEHEDSGMMGKVEVVAD